jgi:hypothetical protein
MEEEVRSCDQSLRKISAHDSATLVANRTLAWRNVTNQSSDIVLSKQH